MEPSLVSLVIPRIGGYLVKKAGDRLTKTLNKTDIDKAIEAGEKAVKEWEKELPPQQLLFYSAKRDGWNGFNKFLSQYFQHSAVLTELEKPLINLGKPDIEILIRVFQQEAEAKNIPLNQDSLKSWLEIFINAYFQHTNTYIKFQVAKQNYFEQLENWYDDVKFAGIPLPGQEKEKSEKLVNIFVMPDVEKNISTGKNLEPDFLLGESGEKLENMKLKNATGRKFLASELLTQSQSQKFVILGVPGSGKTTLMSYFAVILAQKKSQLLGLDANTDWLPILIRMRDLTLHPNKSILEFAGVFAEKIMQGKTLPMGFFEHWLEDGRALILLDGLDEVAEEGKRYDVVRRIENFLGQFYRNRAIITSRPAGYRRDFFRTEEFPHYQMQPFDDEKISAFINNWYDSRFRDKAEAERRKESLRKALDDNDRIKLLARNPLLLTIIALIHRYQAVLPKQRYRLYDKAVETLLTSWDENKEFHSHEKLKYLELDDLRSLMEFLALQIHTGNVESDRGGTLIDRDELMFQLSREIKQLKQVQLYQAKQEAERFVDLIRERTGLLNEQGQDCYGFVHKTFQEYLCAEEINYQLENELDFGIILNAIGEHLHDAHWREVLLLLIAQQKPKNVAKAIRAVLNYGSEYEEWLHQDLFFAGNCLAEDPKGLRGVDGELVQEILERLVELEVSSGKLVGEKVREQVYQIFCSLYETDFEGQALEMLKERADLIDEERLLKYRGKLGEKNQVITILRAQLKDEDSDIPPNAVYIFAYMGKMSYGGIRSILGRYKSYKDEDYYIRMRAFQVLLEIENNPKRIVNFILGERVSETVVDIVVASFQNQNSALRRSAVDTFSQLGKKSEILVNTLLPVLQDQNSFIVLLAAFILGKWGNRAETVVSHLLSLLQDEDFFIRLLAVFTLKEFGKGSEILVNPLLPLLQDKSYFVRSMAVNALGDLGNNSETVVSALLTRLEDKDSDVRRNAVDALGKLGNNSETVVSALLARLRDKDFYVRRNAVDALDELGNNSETVVSALLALLEDEDPDVRQNAALALRKLDNNPEVVVSTLLSRLEDENSNTKQKAVDVLGKLGNNSEIIVNALLPLLEDDDSALRLSAATTLQKLGNNSEIIVNALLPLLEDDDSALGLSAATTLQKLGNNSEILVSTLIKLLQNKDFSVRWSAAQTLLELGNSSEILVKTLITLLQDEDSIVPWRVANALGNLGNNYPNIISTIIQLIQQHQDSEYVGRSIDVLWDLVVGEEN